MKLKKKLKDNQIILSIIALIAGIYVFVLGLFSVVLESYAPDTLLSMADMMGNWIYWLFVLSIFVVIAFSWYLVDLYLKMQEFKELMDTESKSKFIKNIARIETLAIHLGSDYEDKVVEKEEEYNINR
ncbi:MAG: DUF3198 domain-containing protein [Candidatus Saliniplasma sp.]